MTDVTQRPAARGPRGIPGAAPRSGHSGHVSSTTVRRAPGGREPQDPAAKPTRPRGAPGPPGAG